MWTLTEKQRQILDFIRDEIEKGRSSPSIREIAQHFGFRSTRAACDHLDALEKKNFIVRTSGKARSIRLADSNEGKPRKTVSISILGHIPAGPPTMIEEEPAGRQIDIDSKTLGFRSSNSVFALVVHGDSMIGRGIRDGDTVIVDASRAPRDGDIVVALIDNECTLKTLIKQHGKFFLKPENPEYDALVPSVDLQIQGVARTLIRNLAAS